MHSILSFSVAIIKKMFASIRDRPTTPLELDRALQHAVHEKNARSVEELLRRGAYVGGVV